MNLKEEVDELWDLKLKIESQSFQKHIMEPLYKEIDKMKSSYECRTMNELATLKGEAKGLKFLIKLLKNIDTDLKNKKNELESQV